MTLLPSIPTKVTCEEVAACTEGDSQLFTKEIGRAVSRANNLIRPAAALEWVRVVSTGPTSITVMTSTAKITLETGEQSKIWHHAKKILVSVVTIGPLLDQHICKLNQSRDSLGAYLLDCAGIAALRQAGTIVCQLAEKKALEHQWGVGGIAGPGGIDGWYLDDQQQICTLVPIDDINVKIDNKGILYPLKTVSGLIPIGPGYKRQTVGSTCRHCCQQETCTMASD